VPNPGRLEDPKPKLADRFDRSAHWLLLAVIPLALIALVDLPTGWLLDDRRMDSALLVFTAASLWCAHSWRRFAGRVRAGGVALRPTRRKWVLEFASVAALLAMGATMGYLIGGWAPAVAFPATTIVLTAAVVAVAMWQRRQLIRGR
jgi:hypothetical protein